MPGLLDLPTELMELVVEELIEGTSSRERDTNKAWGSSEKHNGDILHFRLVCHKTDADSLRIFCKRFMSNLEFIVTTCALEGLLALSRNSTIASAVERITILHYSLSEPGQSTGWQEDEVAKALKGFSAERRQVYTNRLREQDFEQRYVHPNLLTRTLSKFPNCHEIYLDGIPAYKPDTWTFDNFFDAKRLIREPDIGMELFIANQEKYKVSQKSFVEQFRMLLFAIASAGQVISSLVCLKCIVPPDAFYIPDSQARLYKPVLAHLRRLEISLQSGHRAESLPPADSFCQFLTMTTQLEVLDLQLSYGDDKEKDLFVHRCLELENPAWPRLAELKLRHFAGSCLSGVLQFILRFDKSLVSLLLKRGANPICPSGHPSITKWPDFFTSLRDGTHLRCIGIQNVYTLEHRKFVYFTLPQEFSRGLEGHVSYDYDSGEWWATASSYRGEKMHEFLTALAHGVVCTH